MRKVLVTKKEFDDVLYIAISIGKLSESNLDTSYRLGKKLRTGSTEQEETTNLGFALRKLDSEEKEFTLEEDEWNLLKKRLTSALENFSAESVFVYHGLLATVKEAIEEKVPEEDKKKTKDA